MSRQRSFCFTINNPTEEDTNLLRDYENDNVRVAHKIQYIVFGEETGDSGTHHYQGFVYFVNPRTIRGLSRVPGFSRAHIENCNDRSSGYCRAINYCKKGEQSHEEWEESHEEGPNFGHRAIVFEAGNAPQAQGSRNDLSTAVTLLRNNNFDLNFLAREEPELYVRHYRGFEALRERLDVQRRNFKTKVIWIYGPTGVGKSKFISTLMTAGIDVYWKVPTMKWYNQYQHQMVMALDDYRKGGGYLLFNDMLRLFDRYPLQVETKGGATQFLTKYIIVTSCQSPVHMWEGHDQEKLDQLLRRIEHVIELPNHLSELRLVAIRNEICDTCGVPQLINMQEIEGENQFNENLN